MILRGSLLGASVALAVFGGLAGLASLEACSSGKLAGPGGDCFVATDCQAGLVCIEQKDKSRICTNDLTRALGSVPPEASVPDASEEGGEGGTGEPTDAAEPVDRTTPPPPKDSGTPPPPMDSGPG